jgi:ABC-2 type transport system ATP-binding protein
MSDIAISVADVSKDFRLPHEKNSTIKSAIINSLRGKKSRTMTTQHALKDISFDIQKGEFFGIVGRNGSGKSTLLKIIAGIYQPSKGKVLVGGKLVPFIELGLVGNIYISMGHSWVLAKKK